MKKILILVLTMVMLLSFGIVASATDAQQTTTAEEQLTTDLANAKDGDTVTLTGDVTLSSPLAINKSITLDGNGYTLTSSANRAINVGQAGLNQTVTIQNLTIVGGTTCERGINLVQSSSIDLTINNVTLLDFAYSGYYSVNVAGSAVEANVEINNSNIKGFIPVMVTGTNRNFEINNTSLTAVAYNYNDPSAAIRISSYNTEVVVNGGSISVDIQKSDSSQDFGIDHINAAVIVSDTSSITISPETEVNAGEIAYLEIMLNPDTAFYTIQDAFDFAAKYAGYTYILTRDVVLDETLELLVGANAILDLNGKTVTFEDNSSAAACLLKNLGSLTIIDTSAEKSGKLTFRSTTPSASYSTSTILNAGTLNIQGGTIENTTEGGTSYAVDNTWYSQNAQTNVNGGALVANGTAIRESLTDGIFTFKGYSISEDGKGITAGYTVNKELLSAYCQNNGVTISLGAAFALTQIDSNAIHKSFDGLLVTSTYNVIINGIKEEHYDIALAMALYVEIDGTKKYITVNGTQTAVVDATDVQAITYNEIKEMEVNE